MWEHAKYWTLNVCQHVCTEYAFEAFHSALRYGDETWHRIGDEPMRFKSIFSKGLNQSSKVIQKSNCFRNGYGHQLW